MYRSRGRAGLFFGVGQVADASKGRTALLARGLGVPRGPRMGHVHQFLRVGWCAHALSAEQHRPARFVYYQESGSKEARLNEDGTVSMETPVLYFYSDKEQRATVRVDFPQGWITEWYPYAASAPGE